MSASADVELTAAASQTALGFGTGPASYRTSAPTTIASQSSDPSVSGVTAHAPLAQPSNSLLTQIDQLAGDVISNGTKMINGENLDDNPTIPFDRTGHKDQLVIATGEASTGSTLAHAVSRMGRAIRRSRLRRRVRSAKEIAECLAPKQRQPAPSSMLGAVMDHVAALAERREVARSVVGGVVIAVGGGQHDAGAAHDP